MGYRGKIVRKATVYSNDPRNPLARIRINAFVIPVISVRPSRVFFNGFPDEQLEKEIVIMSNKKEPLMLKIKNLSLPSQIKYKLALLRKGCVFRLTIWNKAREPGTYRERLVLETNYKERPVIVIPVFGRILDEIQVIPKSVDFGRIRKDRFIEQEQTKGESNKTLGMIKSELNRDIIIRLNRGKDLKISGVEIDKNLFQTEIKESMSGRGYRIKIMPMIGKMDKGTIETTLTIHTNHMKYPFIKVPVRAIVK